MKPRPSKRNSGHQPSDSQRAPVLAVGAHSALAGGITLDVKDANLGQEEARRSAQLYSRLVNSLDCIIWEADANTFQFSFVSPHAERILGYPVEQWLSPGFWAQHIHPADVEWCVKFCLRATEEGRGHEFEYRMIAADGRTVWLHDVVSVYVVPDGPKRLIGVMIDVTSRRAAETALRESEERFRLVFEKSAAGMVITDVSGHIIHANKSFCDFLMFSEEELRGKSILEVTHPADREVNRACLEQVQQGRISRYDLEKRYIRRDCEVVWGRASIVFQFPEGRAACGISVVQDITERKRAEQLLHTREAQLRSILDNLQDAYFRANPSDHLTLASPSAPKMYGYESVQQMIGLPVQALYADPRDGALFLDALRRTGHETDWVARCKKKDGTTFWVSMNVQLCRDEAGQIVGTEGFLRDISRRKCAEDALGKSEEHFRLLVEQASDGIAIADSNDRWIEVNSAWAAMFGSTREEITGQKVGENAPGEEKLRVAEELARLTGGKTLRSEWKIRRKDGTVFPCELSAKRLPDGRLQVIARDVTERKRAEELLRESEERFRTIFENAGLGAALVDRQGHPVKCNPALQKMLGFTEDELRNMTFTEFTHPDDKDRDWRLYEELVAGTRDRYEIEKRYIGKNGQVIWGQLTVSLVRNKDGTPAEYTVGMVEDITERKRAERELTDAHEQLTKELAERTRAEAEIVRLSERLINAQEEERQRIARELHDHLSQQVAALGIALSNIKRLIPAGCPEGREQAERAYDRLLALGEGIRHLSHELHPAIIEHAGLVAALESYCAEFESLTHVKVTVQAVGEFDNLPARVQLGIYRITQEALQNIWKHSGVKKGAIRLMRAGERVQLQVCDQGVGFDTAQPAKVASLGLTSMRERARLLGGTFTVKTSAGHGTTVIADIPVSPAPADETSN